MNCVSTMVHPRKMTKMLIFAKMDNNIALFIERCKFEHFFVVQIYVIYDNFYQILDFSQRKNLGKIAQKINILATKNQYLLVLTTRFDVKARHYFTGFIFLKKKNCKKILIFRIFITAKVLVPCLAIFSKLLKMFNMPPR